MNDYRTKFINSYLRNVDKDKTIECLANMVMDLENSRSQHFINEDRKMKELECMYQYQQQLQQQQFHHANLLLEAAYATRERVNLDYSEAIHRINTDYHKASEGNSSKEKIQELKCNRDIEIARIESETKRELSKNDTSIEMAKLEATKLKQIIPDTPIEPIIKPETLDNDLLENMNGFHAFIMGTTGSGKSEIIKTMANYHIKSPSHSVILIDPKDGKLANQVAELRSAHTSTTKVTLFSPASKDNAQVFNVFDVDKKILKANETIITSAICSSMASMFDLSEQMKTFLFPHVKLMLHCKDGSFSLLRKYLNDNYEITTKNQGKKAYKTSLGIKENYHDSEVYKNSKEALIKRIDRLCENKEFLKATDKKTTINLQQVMNGNELLCIDLSGLHDKELLGALMITMIQCMGSIEKIARGSDTYLIVDECHNFQIESLATLLTESRADKLFTILATQFIGKITQRGLKEAILESTNVKVSAHQSNTEGSKSTAILLSLDMKEAPKLKELDPKKGECYLSLRGKTATKIINPDTLVNTP